MSNERRFVTMSSISGIYVISHLKSGKVYLGQAQNIRVRWQKHKQSLNSGKHDNRHLQSAWNKYGAKAFQFKVLEYCSIEQLDEREQHYLNIYMPKGICFNLAQFVGTVRGIVRSDETRQKMSEVQKGRKLTDEHRLKLSEAHKGKPLSIEHRRSQSEAAKHRPPIRDETRKRKSEAAKNISEETRQKYRDAAKLREARKRAERDEIE
jgi:group I intron endonuclease